MSGTRIRRQTPQAYLAATDALVAQKAQGHPEGPDVWVEAQAAFPYFDGYTPGSQEAEDAWGGTVPTEKSAAIDRLVVEGGGGGALRPRTGAGNPNGVLTARFVGDDYFDTAGGVWYRAQAETNAAWVLI